MRTESLVGKELICAETGKRFIGAADGCSTNYALDNQGLIYSDEGVDLREKRELLDRSKPFGCYLSCDGKTVTGWKGNVLGRVTSLTFGGGFGGRMAHVRAVDVHGGLWFGRGAGQGMCITLRPCKPR